MSNSNRISVDKLESEIIKYLQEYKENIDEEVKETSDEVTKQACKELKTISPKANEVVYLRKSNSKLGIGSANYQNPGEYASGWTIGKKSGKKNKNQYSKIAYNKGFYRLTHLLEFGHANRDGSRTQPIPHIRKTEEKYKEKFKNELEGKIRRGL